MRGVRSPELSDTELVGLIEDLNGAWQRNYAERHQR